MFKTISILIIGIMLVSCGKKESNKSSALGQAAVQTYLALTETSYSKEAEIQMKNMYQSASNYYLRYGVMPSDCFEEMETRGMIEMKQNVVDSWDFQCDWEFDDAEKEILGTITASSTENNEAGPGKQLILDIQTNTYTGYGQGSDE